MYVIAVKGSSVFGFFVLLGAVHIRLVTKTIKPSMNVEGFQHQVNR